MIDEQKLRELAEALKGFGLTSARGVDGDDSGQAELGQELDGEFYSVGIFDTFQYDAPEVSLKLANFYAAANPAATLDLLDELQSLRSERTALLVNEQNLQQKLEAIEADRVSRDVPAVWKLVPEDPTKLMLAKACAVDWSNEDGDAAALNIWQAMLAASTQPQPVQASQFGSPELQSLILEKLAQPVQAQPSGWQPIETAPDDMTEPVLVFWIDSDGAPMREFDYKEDGCWIGWHEHAEHVHVIGGHGVSYTPPYTSWMQLPPPPANQQKDHQ